MDRKRELDVTKERMDGLVEKLYVGALALPACGVAWLRAYSRHPRTRTGREKGLELRGAIDSHLERYGHATAQATPEPPPVSASASAEQAPPPSAAASKADTTTAGPARTPPASQAKARKTTPEAGTGRGYADLSRATKAKTPS